MNENEIKLLFGRRIKMLRNSLNLTQFALGEKVDVNQRQIALIESGKSFPSLKTIAKFSQIFSLKINELFLFDNMQNTEILKQDLQNIIKSSSENKIKILYTIAKELN